MKDIRLSSHGLLEYICKEVDGEKRLLEFAIWKLILQNLTPEISVEDRRKLATEACKKEIDKWIR